MSFSSIGDLANSLLLNRQGTSVRSTMNTLSKELSTGLKSDTRAAVRGDYAGIADWEARISREEVRTKTLSEHLARAKAKGEILGTTGAALVNLANDIDITQSSQSSQGNDRIAKLMRGALEDFVNRLNTKIAGQSLFAGNETDASAVISSSDILAEAKAAINGATTVSDVYIRLDAWLADGSGGFAATVFTGASEEAANVRLDDVTTISIPGRGDSNEIKAAMRGLLIGGLVTDSDLGFSNQVQAHLLSLASQDLRTADGSLTDLQARIGHAESRIEKAQVRASTQIATAKQMRLDMLAADPYETATKLQNAELQLEKIYALTARSARMSLMEYLR